MLACKSGYLDLVRVLLNQGADIDALDKEGTSAFGHAITSEKGENIGLIDLLIEKGADVSKGKFEWNTEEGDKKRARPDKKIKGFSGIKGDMGSYSEIHKKKKFYVKSGRSVRNEVKVARKGIWGFDCEPVGIAIRRRFEAVAIKLLLILKNHDKKDSFSGNSYLHLAVFHRTWKVVDFLLKKGLDPQERNNHDKSAWAIAQEEETDSILKSFVQSKTTEQNFKKKKFKKNRKKRKKKKVKGAIRDKNQETEIKGNLQKNNISIDPSSSQKNSSKGGFLLSQLSLDPDSQGNKLLNDISGNGSSNRAKTDRNLWDDLSVDSKLDLKNNLSTDRSTQDLHSVYAQKNELKTECRKLEIKLNKLVAENDFITNEDAKNSWSMVLERRLSDIKKPNPEDSLMSENIPCNETLQISKRTEPNASAGKLLDYISNQSVTSGMQDQGKKGFSMGDNTNETDIQIGCSGCLDLISKLPCSGQGLSLNTKLGTELLEFEEEISVLNSMMKDKYKGVQEEVERLIGLVHDGPFQLEVYGSFANGLNIPGSDLDLLLIFNNSSSKPQELNSPKTDSSPKKCSSRHRLSEDIVISKPTSTPRKYTDPFYPEISQQDFQNKLICEAVLEDLNEKAEASPSTFSESKYLRNAQVPVLKLVTSANWGGFPVDVTAHDPRHQGLECVNLVKGLVTKYPPLKPIVLVLKQMLNMADLSDPYLGGLSSYGLVVMIVAYFQKLEINHTHTKDLSGENETRLRSNWNEDARLSYQKGSRRQSRKKSTNNKMHKCSSKVHNMANQTNIGNSRRTSISKKRSKKKNSFSTLDLSACLFSRSAENIGKLLLGFLYFFGFEFNMHSQKIRIFLDFEEPEDPFQQVV
jgi:ankyrin repeat protein